MNSGKNNVFITTLNTLENQLEEEMCVADVVPDKNIQHISHMKDLVLFEEIKTALRRTKNEKFCRNRQYYKRNLGK